MSRRLPAICLLLGGSAIAAAPPTLLKDIGRTITPNSSDPNQYTALGQTGISVFFARISADQSALCRTDGTAAGTFVLNSFSWHENTSFKTTGAIAPLGSGAVFSRKGNGDDWELWKTDGSIHGTTLIKAVSGMDSWGGFRGVPTQLTPLGGRVIMSAYTVETGGEIWATDGTAEGTVLLRDIQPGPLPIPFSFDSSLPKNLTASNGVVYFSADDGASGAELWKTDGTPSGTVFVKELTPGSSGSQPTGFTHSHGLTYFTANGRWTTNVPLQDAAFCEVWRTDGTGSGTFRLMDLPGATDGVGFHPVGSTTVFVQPHRYGSSPSGGQLEFPGQFLQTDGTPEGTVPWVALPQPMFSPSATWGVTTGNHLIYQMRGPAASLFAGWELAGVKDGNFTQLMEGGVMTHAFHAGSLTVQLISPDEKTFLRSYQEGTGVTQPFPTVEAEGISSLTSTAGHLIANYRGPYAARSGHEPWVLQPDGGASLLGDLHPGATLKTSYSGPAYGPYGPYSGNQPEKPFLLRGTFVFPAFGDSGAEIWKSDGSVDGTTVLKDIVPGTDGHYSLIQPKAPQLLLTHQVGQLLYFIRSYQEPPYAAELWVTDGSEPGTRRILEDRTGIINGILPWTDGVWWIQYGRTSSALNTVWLTDGTAGGTRPVKDIAPGADGSGLSACFNNTTYTFLTKNNSTGNLWEIHPDPDRIRSVFEFVRPGEAPVRVRAMTVFDGGLYFFLQRQANATRPTPRAEIWRMAPGGNPVLMLVMPDSAATSDFSDILPGTRRIFFNATSGVHASQGPQQASLWVTDGTAAGTRRATPPDSALRLDHLRIASVVADDRLFTAHSGDEAGYELWTNDGTPESTRRLTGQTPAAPGLASGGRPRQIIRGGDGYVYFDNETITNLQPVRRIWRVSALGPGEPEAFGELPERHSYDSDGIYFLPHTLFRAHDRLYASCYTSGGGHEFHWWPAPSAATPYSEWAGVHDLTLGAADPLADPDADGHPNLLEFSAGSLPRSSASNPSPAVTPDPIAGGNRVFMSFRRMEGTGLSLTVESSVDALTWNPDHLIAPDGTITSGPVPPRRSHLLSRTGNHPEIITLVANPDENRPRILLRVRAHLNGP